MGTLTAPAVDLELRESLAAPPREVDTSGKTALLEAIRPCLGRGKGRHLYEAAMLERNAGKLRGWRMYLNHESEKQKKDRGGLPRPVEHYGGRVLESYWDPEVPADPDKGYGQGAVMARVRMAKAVREIIEDDPEAIECSINARATAVHPRKVEGSTAWVVEGLESKGSLDWVTEGGAGGRVASLLESAYHDDDEVNMALLETMTDTQFADYLRENRPDLLEALTPKENEPVAENTDAPQVQIDPVEMLREALGSHEGREMLRALTEEDIREESEIVRQQASAEARREVELERMRAAAHAAIREAKLPEAFESDLIERYDIDENGAPTPSLDVVDEVDASGALVKRAAARLREAVAHDVSRSRDLIEAVKPTRVTGQGADGEREVTEGAEPEGGKPEGGKAKTPLWERQLQEAGFEDPSKVYEF